MPDNLLNKMEEMGLSPKHHVHGINLKNKLKKFQKKGGDQFRILHDEIIPQYIKWHRANKKRISPQARTNTLNEYKNFLRQYESYFSAQSKVHSTVIEEFLYYLFRDLNSLKDLSLQLGCGIRAYSNLYFSPPNLKEFSVSPFTKINEKDQDFAIYKAVEIKVENETKHINIPIVSIECKTYLDKTMLEGSIATAEKIKFGNPYCLFLVVTETYDVSTSVDPKYSRIDQIYVIRKGFRKQRASAIDKGVIASLVKQVEDHLSGTWSDVKNKIKTKGVAL